MLGVTLGRNPPRLDKTQYSEGLSDLVAFVLETKPADRPSMQEVLQHPYILNTEETHPTQSLAELVKVYYRWEHSGGQRQSLFINAGAAAAEFPSILSEEDDWNFSTTSNFEKELDQFSFEPDSTALLESSEHAVELSFRKHPHLPSIVIPGYSSKDQAEISDQGGEVQTPTGDLTPAEKLNTEERVKRGEKALKGLFNEGQSPYEYKVKADFVEQKSVQKLGPLGKPLSRTRSDLPLRDESVQSSVHRKELDADQLRSASYDTTPNIDLANVGTIKANRMNRFIDNMGQDDKVESCYYRDSQDEDKRATKEWTFPQAMYDEGKSKEAKSLTISHDPKRATIEWGFPPEMQAGRNVPPPMYERPALKHTVTAPVGEIRHSMAGMIDLDALYDSELYDSDILRTAPVSDDEGGTGATSEDEAIDRSRSNNTDAQGASDGDMMTLQASSGAGEDSSTSQTASATSTEVPSEIGNEYDPFLFDDSSDDDIKAQINAMLDDSQVMDEMDRATLRREYLKASKAMPKQLKEDMEEAAYRQYKKRRFATAVGNYAEK